MKNISMIWLIACFSLLIVGEVKSGNTSATECADCPRDVYMQGTSLMLKFAQVPTWTNQALTLPTYYFDGNGNSYGPLTLKVKTITTSYAIFELTNFPVQALPINGSFVFAGGIIQCRYDLIEEQVELVGCQELDENCGCPVLDLGPTHIGLSFQPLEPNIPYSTSDDLEIIVKWGDNLVGPVTATHTNGYYWSANLPDAQNPCCGPFTGEVIINFNKVCVYQDHFLESCNNDPIFFSSNCPEIGDCQGYLSDLIQNIAGNGCPHFKSACDETSFLYRFGKVEIGTTLGPVGDGLPSTPNGYNLSVDGSIVTDIIKVELCGTGGWCDYVFGPTYNLMPLSGVKSFTSNYGHLPNMPSENDIKTEGGIKTKEVMLAQQEKVEEIFLYLIEMDEQINQIQQKINLLKVENSMLSRDIK